MLKKSLQRCDQHLVCTVEKMKAKGRTGFREEGWELPTALRSLMERLCLFRKLSPLYQAFQRPLSPPPSTSTAGNMPVTKVTNVSLAAGARPFPPEDPKRGSFWDPLGVMACHSSTSSAEEPLMTKRTPLLTALMYRHSTVLGLGKPEDRGWWRWEKGDGCILSCRYQVRARLATE